MNTQRKRNETSAYFSPPSDPFQPIPEVLEMAFEVFQLLLSSGIGMAFVTKGRIPQRHRRLLAALAPRIDPILPGLSDSEDALCAALVPAGVRRVAASVLFLGPAVIGSLKRHVADKVSPRFRCRPR